MSLFFEEQMERRKSECKTYVNDIKSVITQLRKQIKQLKRIEENEAKMKGIHLSMVDIKNKTNLIEGRLLSMEREYRTKELALEKKVAEAVAEAEEKVKYMDPELGHKFAKLKIAYAQLYSNASKLCKFIDKPLGKFIEKMKKEEIAPKHIITNITAVIKFQSDGLSKTLKKKRKTNKKEAYMKDINDYIENPFVQPNKEDQFYPNISERSQERNNQKKIY